MIIFGRPLLTGYEPLEALFNLPSHPNFTSDPVLYDANAIHKPENAPAAYQSLYKTFAGHTYNTGFDKFHKWITLKYVQHPTIRYPRGQYLSYDVHSNYPLDKRPRLKLSELVPTLTGESNLASWSTALKYALDTRDPLLFEIFTGHTAQPAPEDPSPPKWTRQFRHLLSYLHATVHASLKPCINTAINANANANTNANTNANAAKSANAVNTPALTSSLKTTYAVTSYPTVRYNNLFTN